MRIKRSFYLGCLAAVAVVSCLGQNRSSSVGKPGASKAEKPLIRMDLLQNKERNAAEAKRDIFIPQNPYLPAGVPFPAVELRKPDQGAEEGKAPGEIQESPLALRYVGYIQGRKKITALILFEGKAVAVEEGDEFSSAWKVAKITTGGIEIQGQDGKSQTFALEGERK